MTITVNMKRMPNLSEEIAAMAFSTTSALSSDLSRDEDGMHKYPQNLNLSESMPKKRRSRSRLVQEIRISVSVLHFYLKNKNIEIIYPIVNLLSFEQCSLCPMK